MCLPEVAGRVSCSLSGLKGAIRANKTRPAVANSMGDPGCKSQRHRFNDPLRVVPFNTFEHWARGVSEDTPAEIQIRLDVEGNQLPELIRDFVESHRHNTRRLSLGLA